MLIYDVHSSWNDFLTDDIKNMLGEIEEKIGDDFTPERPLVLRFLSLDLNKIKVVILGQDPYKPKGVATGRSFEPSDLNDWHDKFRQVSLKNILRLIYRSYNNIENYEDIPSYTQLLKEIDSGNFPIKPPHDWFDSLEEQGVLFLNTALTCKIGVSGSHSDIWAPFSDRLIRYIAEHNKKAVWFLWGSLSKHANELIGDSKSYISRHPMMCSQKYEDDFLKNECFLDTKDIINWLG